MMTRVGTSRWWASGVLLFGLGIVNGCSEAVHHEPLGDYDLEACEADAGERCAGPTSAGNSAGRTPIEYECLTDEQTAGYDDPLESTVMAFRDDRFEYEELRSIDGTAELRTLGRLPRTWACVTTEAGDPFQLFGGATSSEDGGLRVDPVGHDSFVPTMIQKVERAGRAYPAIPVVATTELELVFSTLDIERNPEKGLILIEVVNAPSTGEITRLPGVELRSEAAEAVAYRGAGGWSTELQETSVDGLALLVNVNSAPDFGVKVGWHYVNRPYSEMALPGPENLYSITGGITYLAFQPESISP